MVPKQTCNMEVMSWQMCWILIWYKGPFFRYMDSHPIDKILVRLVYLYDENFNTIMALSLYWSNCRFLDRMQRIGNLLLKLSHTVELYFKYKQAIDFSIKTYFFMLLFLSCMYFLGVISGHNVLLNPYCATCKNVFGEIVQSSPALSWHHAMSVLMVHVTLYTLGLLSLIHFLKLIFVRLWLHITLILIEKI